MPLTLDAVREELEAEEPDYEALAASLGPAALVHLEELARQPDAMVAPRAVHLAALIPDSRAVTILDEAAQNPDTRMRVAAAGAAAALGATEASAIVARLLGDPEPRVRRAAVESTPLQPSAALETALRSAATLDSESFVRECAGKALARVVQARD